MKINVSNVGEAKAILKANKIKIMASGYTDGESGWVKVFTCDFEIAEYAIKAFGI